MKKLLLALALLPLMTGVAVAGQHRQLSDKQMDKVTAGFDANAWADAQGLGGESSIVTTYTATLSKVAPYARLTNPAFEQGSTLYIAVSAAQSTTLVTTYTPSPIPGTSRGN